jgi:excisionase family DNA binding protein
MTVNQLAAYLNVSRATLYRAMYDDGLPVIVLGDRTKRFRREDIDAWLDGRRSG